MRLGLRGQEEPWRAGRMLRTRTRHPSTTFSVSKGHPGRTPSLSSHSDTCHWLLCLQHGCRQPGILKNILQACGSGPGAWEERGENPQKPQGGPLPRSIGEECSQPDWEKRSVEGSRPRCRPRRSGAASSGAGVFPRSLSQRRNSYLNDFFLLRPLQM